MTYAERIEIIADACEYLNIPHEVVDICDGKQIRFPWTYGDIACHSWTYGAEHDKVESYQFPWDKGDVSVLSVGEAIAYLVDMFFGLSMSNISAEQ